MEIILLDFRGETIHRNLGVQRFGSLSLIQDLLVKTLKSRDSQLLWASSLSFSLPNGKVIKCVELVWIVGDC